jgi:hypothetical protein
LETGLQWQFGALGSIIDVAGNLGVADFQSRRRVLNDI